LANGYGSIISIAVVGALIIIGIGYTYTSTENSLTTLSNQNYALDQQVVNLNFQNSNLNQQVGSLQQQVSTLEQRTVQVVTVTNTVQQIITITTVTSVTTTSTSTVYPIPDNVTVYIAPSGQFMNYAISAGSYATSGSLGHPQSFSVSPVYQGEAISVSITLSCPGSTGPSGSAVLYVNGTSVSRADVACGGQVSGQISYVL
jgi:hypothetical protein